MTCCVDAVDPAERDAALTMCMISGSSDGGGDVSDALHAVIHDHCYTKCPLVVAPPTSPLSPSQQVTVKLRTRSPRVKGSG